MQGRKLLMLEPGVLIPTSDNPRGKIDEASDNFQALVTSIRGEGVRVPVQARPHPQQKGKYELLDGSRRHRAATLAKRKLPTVVLDVDDVEAFQIVVAANFAREDLSPREQGKAAEILLKKFGGDVHAAAAAIGQTPRWIAQRANLKKLAGAIWAAIADGAKWGVGHLCQIARLPKETQEFIAHQYHLHDATVAGLEKYIKQQLLRRIRQAPWPIDKPGPGDGPACLRCPARSSRQPLLWHDTEEQAKKNDSCLRAECWHDKMLRHARQLAEKLEAEKGKCLLVDTSDWSTGYRDEIVAKVFGKVELEKLGKYGAEYELCGKKEKGSVPAVVVNAQSLDSVGTQVWVKRRASSPSSSSRRPGVSSGEEVTKRAFERQRLADQFALAAGCIERAMYMARNGTISVSEDDFTADAAAACALATGHQHCSPAWSWLLARCGMSRNGPGRPWNFLHLSPALPEKLATTGRAIWALGLFLGEAELHLLHAGESDESSDARTRVNPAWEGETLHRAAQRFKINGHFLEAHLAVNVVTIAKCLGVPAGGTKKAVIERIIGAELPPGAMTPELAGAFRLAQSDLVVCRHKLAGKVTRTVIVRPNGLLPEGWLATDEPAFPGFFEPKKPMKKSTKKSAKKSAKKAAKKKAGRKAGRKGAKKQ